MAKKALIVGINAYPQSPLNGCVNDANDWNATLTIFGYTNTVLLDSMATKSNILSGLTWLLSNATSCDSLVFAFSGHGSKIADTSGDEPDSFDEVICPVDVFSGQYIVDDDLRTLFNGLSSNVTLDVFLDSCYSGTATRGLTNPNMKARCIPGPLTAGKKIRKISRLTTIVPTLNHILWTASRDNQTSVEVNINGNVRGLFSYYANKYIRQYSNYPRGSLITAIQNAVSKINSNQTPQLECTSTENTQKPFT